MRIGLVADTHVARDPLTLIEALGKQTCDFYVHLGDIGGSQLTSKLVHEFKQAGDNLSHLSRDERERFEQLKSQGMAPTLAYIEMRVGHDRDARERQLMETSASYARVVGSMSRLSPVYFLSGNIDRFVFRSDRVGPTFERNGVTLITEPEVIEFPDQAVVLWPSMKHLTPQLGQDLDRLVGDLSTRLRSKRRVIVLAHEQLFKGPPPKRYRENVARAGYKALTVPYFEPNPTYRYLLKMFRSLPSSVDLAFVHGHVHDPCRVIQAGAPYLKGNPQLGLVYRLHGIAATLSPGQHTIVRRRTLRIFCVPANEAMVLALEDRGVKMRGVGGTGR